MGKSKPDAKHFFSPIPARAAVDRRLKNLHRTALEVIALHDRMGRNGQGCTAGNERLKEMIGCDYTRLSQTIGDLEEWRYVDRRPDPKDGRRTVLSIIYDDEADAAVMKNAAQNNLRSGKRSKSQSEDDSLRAGKESKGGRTDEGLRAGKPSADDGLHDGEDPAEIVCPDFPEAAETKEKTQRNIFRETVEDIPLKGEAYTPEGAPPDGGAAAAGADGGDAHAREAVGREDGPEPNGPPQHVDAGFLAAVRKAANAPEKARWTDALLRPVVDRWLNLGHSREDVLAFLSAKAATRSGCTAINAPSYFDGFMAELAMKRAELRGGPPPVDTGDRVNGTAYSGGARTTTTTGKPWFCVIDGGGDPPDHEPPASLRDAFETFCRVYPPTRHGWPEGRRAAALVEFEHAVERGLTPDEIIAKVLIYVDECRRDGNPARTQSPVNWLRFQHPPRAPAF